MAKLESATRHFSLESASLAECFLAVLEQRPQLLPGVEETIILKLLTYLGLRDIKIQPGSLSFGPRQLFDYKTFRVLSEQSNTESGWIVSAANRQTEGATMLLEDLWRYSNWWLRMIVPVREGLTTWDEVHDAVAETLRRSVGFSPIHLSCCGDFLEDWPDNNARNPWRGGFRTISEPDHLCDGIDLGPHRNLASMRHGPDCGGQIRIIHLSPTYSVIVCDNCHYRREVPRVETFGDLRREMAKILAATNP